MKRRRLLVNGIVQGVGFRPFVVQTAAHLDVAGYVCNTSDGVVIEIEAPRPDLDEFVRILHEKAPPLARVVSVISDEVATTGATGFTIHKSANTPGTNTLIPPDVTVCVDCLMEIRDRHDRRYGYPFTNCTNCGPRWTIIDRIPYDRPYTSMAAFEMCGDCQAEYDDVQDRRFHAQPNACPACGPRVWLEGPVGAIDTNGSPIERAAEAVARHAVVAIRGLGGFHLAVRADSTEAVELLKQRKRRTGKPLAVMVPNLAMARLLARTTEAEAKLLASPAAPIVLLEKHPDCAISSEIAPGHRHLGLMLPSTPLHHLLFDALARHGIKALVMTSGNASEEPICIGNDEAKRHLAAIADVYLLHDREILRRADDSLVQVIDGQTVTLRRGRGLAPVPIFTTDTQGCPPILAVGTQMKNTVCLQKDGRAFLSPHIGDLGQLGADDFFRESIATLQDVLECTPAVIAHDLHPQYTATVWAREQQRINPDLQLISVQHHHAHLAAVMAEHQLTGPVVGLIMDGTGYGTDGTIWGGEILVGDAAHVVRAGHFETVPLPGGDAAIKAPWRQAVSYLRQAFGPEFFDHNPDEFAFQNDRPLEPVLEILNRKTHCPLTSSCGRLFDAAAAIIGPWTEATYEAQAAMEMMALTDTDTVAKTQPFTAVIEGLKAQMERTGDCLVMPVSPLIRALREARRAGLSPADLSALFHSTLVEVMSLAASWAATKHSTKNIVLGGGVFHNGILLAGLTNRLRETGLRPWFSQQVPAGDGGVSLGQAAVAAAQISHPREAHHEA